MKPECLVPLFVSTSGASGDDLGSDETELVQLVWQVVDLKNDKVARQTGELRELLIRPEAEELDTEKLEQRGLSEEQIYAAQPLEHALRQFNNSLTAELLSNGREQSFCLCTDGQRHLRQVVHPETSNKNIILPPSFYSFFDLRKEFQKNFPSVAKHKELELQFMADYLDVCVDSSLAFAALKVQQMVKIIQTLVTEPVFHIFSNPESVHDRFETGTCRLQCVGDNTVIRARGLPWQASDKDIARFFRGLNIAKGGAALCLNNQGRRNGEALVCFESQEHRDLGLQRHKHHMANRYIEVYKATGEDFLKIAGGCSSEVAHFLSGEGHVIVRMRGLPYSATPQQVLQFFSDCSPTDDSKDCCPVAGGGAGILLVRYPDGRPTGDAFVLFSSEDFAQVALKKHKQRLGKRYIELFKSTAAEVTQVCNRFSSTPLLPVPPPPLISMMPSPLTTGLLPLATGAFPLVTAGLCDCVRLRGLPYDATVQNILEFLGEFTGDIAPHGVHMVLNAQGRPSGECFIQMCSVERAFLAAHRCHRQPMQDRYVEVFPCSLDDMLQVLRGGALGPCGRGMSPPPCTSAPAFYPHMGAALPMDMGLYPAHFLITPRPLPAHPACYTYYPSPPGSPPAYGFFPAAISAHGHIYNTGMNQINSSDAMVTVPALLSAKQLNTDPQTMGGGAFQDLPLL
ncbi:epithelial splicing regulatory protein 1 isoform X2 [Denticeps clupeoides]|uniref:epithelial splicing regulatory protein 1 isoform X2 n=1 Tax=Denticeps clupeoides TaxID=299321 RepID=UPI0010A3ADD3|nr:epithelial splicing regulatory protein 1 isoform X2 [Denticeps clupeoides]